MSDGENYGVPQLARAIAGLETALSTAADLLIEHSAALTEPQRDLVCAAVAATSSSLTWAGHHFPGSVAVGPVSIQPPQLPKLPDHDGPARWITIALRDACRSLHDIAYEPHTDDHGRRNAHVLNWIAQALATVRARIDLVQALAETPPFTDQAITESFG